MNDDDPWPEGQPEAQHCWLCRAASMYYDIFGIGWCQLHFDRDYLGVTDAPWD